MRAWKERPNDIQALFNPAFCGRLIYATVTEYQRKTGRDFPFALVYLLLPLVLPGKIRNEINSRTKLANWAANHQELLYNFGKRTADLVCITNEAVEFLLQSQYLRLTDYGELSANLVMGTLSKTKNVDLEVRDCIIKAEHVARWFALAGKTEMIYVCLGVRP